jgi:hypothetical protein
LSSAVGAGAARRALFRFEGIFDDDANCRFQEFDEKTFGEGWFEKVVAQTEDGCELIVIDLLKYAYGAAQLHRHHYGELLSRIHT